MNLLRTRLYLVHGYTSGRARDQNCASVASALPMLLPSHTTARSSDNKRLIRQEAPLLLLTLLSSRRPSCRRSVPLYLHYGVRLGWEAGHLLSDVHSGKETPRGDHGVHENCLSVCTEVSIGSLDQWPPGHVFYEEADDVRSIVSAPSRPSLSDGNFLRSRTLPIRIPRLSRASRSYGNEIRTNEICFGS